MRNIFILIYLTAFYAIANDSYAQNTVLTIHMDNATIESILDEIENQSEFYFLFNYNLVDVGQKVNVNVQDQSIGKILSSMFEDTDIEYFITNKQIILAPKGSINKETLNQQVIKVTGKVVDEDGKSMAGVNITIKDTYVGVITNLDGDFSIDVSDPNTILIFSFVGYETKEIKVGDQAVINVTLNMDVLGLNEVIVIGYGTSKKANITGATTTIKSEDVVKRPTVDVSSVLQGRVAGLHIVQNSGQPGDEQFDIKLRGIGSFKNTEPYVLVDGIEGQLDAVNPSDIENITVLKDAASAAIYGARAANGVILVTTKSGNKNTDFKLEASVNLGMQMATRLPDYIYNSVEYMEMWNKGAEHSGVNQRYSDEMIEAYRNAAPGDPRYPNFNWMDYMFKPAVRNEYQLSARGGGERSAVYFNAGYVDQGGIIDGYGSKQYSGRINLDLEISDKITVGLKNGIVYKNIVEPTAESMFEMMLYIYTMPPTMGPFTSDGTGHYTSRDIDDIWRNRNPKAMVDNPGETRYHKYKITPQAYIDIKPFKGLSWKTTAAWRYDRTEKKHSYFDMEGYTFSTNEYRDLFEQIQIGVYNNRYRSSNLYLHSVLNYQYSFNNIHNLKVLAGYEQHEMNYDYLYIYRPEYSSSTTLDINAGNPEGQNVQGRTSSWALQSLFGRIMYDYKGKYLFEGNIRYDGSSKTAEKFRWDIFPSMSLGWRISEEAFAKNLSWLDNLKIRVSAGQLGNVNVLGDYPYQELLTYTTYPIDGSLLTGVSANSLSNPELNWEVINSYNIGVDFSMMNGLFGYELDLYKRFTIGGHDWAQIPNSVGKDAPQENYKDMENKGIELVLKHNNQLGDFKYGVDFIFDRYVNTITKVKDPNWGSSWWGMTTIEGHAYNEYYMLDWIGIYQNQQEVDNLPIHEPYAAITKPGDLIFRDVNGDGEITFEPDSGDKVFMKGYHPTFSYSFNINMEWKNFDLSMFWQGVAGRKNLTRYISFEPFYQAGPPTAKWRNAWDGEGSTNEMPALYNMANYSYLPITGMVSDFYLSNASYLRLKNIQIGYNLPKSLSDRISVDKLRLYLSGDNLITISEFEFDPERKADDYTVNKYPQIKTYSIGARLTF